jgi:hypothetical protein
MVALTGIEPAFGQFSSVQLGLSRYVFSPVQFATRAFRAVRMADVLPRCCPAARIRLLRSAIPLRAGHPVALRPTLRRRVDGDVGDGLTDRLPTLIVNARVERVRSCQGGVHSTVWRLLAHVDCFRIADDPAGGGIKRPSWLPVVGQFQFSAAFASRSSTSFMMSLLCGAWSC